MAVFMSALDGSIVIIYGSDRDYRLLVLSDATADPDPAVHAFLIEHVFPRQPDVITLAELEGLLTAA